MGTAMSRGPMPQLLAKPYLDKAQNDDKSILGLSEHVACVQKIFPNSLSLSTHLRPDTLYILSH